MRRWQLVGVLAVVAIGAMMTFAAPVNAFTLNWDPVTKYTDGTLIGSEANGIFYNVEMDGAIASGNFSGNTWNIPTVAKKSSHTFRVRTVLGTGDMSDWTPPFAWTSPAGVPAVPSGLTVQP